MAYANPKIVTPNTSVKNTNANITNSLGSSTKKKSVTITDNDNNTDNSHVWLELFTFI